ncbi:MULTISPECIES: carbohydrate ABC transporter permease [Microbacterium]|uniref:carbohydrate ABC transporter permease n=1 Tax=Microbacterium TaxID=33882 RepID=UPI0009038054|nr:MULTISPECIES: carbohydrate ABC transporter permease [Microbacterium]APF34769.1 ABC transporter permease [Microbacterium paludicola]POX66094.1 carbohydrate ABC transporter permease [Microbacterium sp. Ru50]
MSTITPVPAPVAAAATTPESPRPTRRRRTRIRWGMWTALAVIVVFGFAPVYWLLVTSLTPSDRVFAFPPAIFPTQVTFEHYATVFGNEQIFGYLRNSVIVSVVTAVLSVVVSMYMGYAFSKYRFAGRKSLMYFVLSSQMFPQALLLVTLYLVFAQFGLLNTYLALILSFTTFTLPLCVWMLKGFFDALPDDLIEAARIDGAGPWRIFHSVVFPLAAPGLVAAGLFAFVRGWNDFIFALTLAGPDRQTLPPGLVNTFISEASTSWPALMAASLVVSVPVCVAFILLQRFLVGGITAGAVKG